MEQPGEQDGRAMRIALAVGDAELERRLARALEAAGMTVAERCLDAASLLEADLTGVDVVVVSRRLHGLSPRALDAVGWELVPVVLLVDEASDIERFGAVAHLVPMGTPAEAIVDAVREARERGLLYDAPGASADSGDAGAGARESDASSRGSVIAVTSGKGAPGKTTLAIALSSLLAARGEEVALVDADLRGGNVATYLDLDPGRGLVTVLRGDATADAIEAALQDGPGFPVIAGVERAALAAWLRPESLDAAVSALRQRFAHVVVDAGSSPGVGGEGAWVGVLQGARVVLLATGADLVSLWNAQVAARAIGRRLPGGAASLGALVNRRDGREHYDEAEVARALEIAVFGAVREDAGAARRAVATQRPLSDLSADVRRDLEPLVSLLAGGAGDQADRRRPRLPRIEWMRARGAGR